MRIACWSGPRNISTAMMRAFASRPDCAASDEPLYAAYLADSGKEHPVRSAILASQPQDWAVVAEQLTGPIPDAKAHWYQKHMAHHMLPDRYGPWLDALVHIFLVRDPAEMLSSLLRAWPEAELEDTGLPQQLAIRDWLDRPIPLVDGREVMDDPAGTLSRLCADLDLPYDSAMLSWPAGPHPADGVWADHWYAAVRASTGFEPWRPREIAIPKSKLPLLRDCERLHRELLA